MTTITTTDITERFAALGICSTREIIEVRDATRRPGLQPSWAIVLAPGAKIPAAAWEHIQAAFSNGNYFVLQLKEVA